MALEHWTFSEAERDDTATVRPYRVVGRLEGVRDYYGKPAESGLGYDYAGMLVGPVIGYGETLEAAHDAAVYAAGQDDARRADAAWRANVAVMGGGW